MDTERDHNGKAPGDPFGAAFNTGDQNQNGHASGHAQFADESANGHNGAPAYTPPTTPDGIPLWSPRWDALQHPQEMNASASPSRSHGLNDPVTNAAPALHPAALPSAHGGGAALGTLPHGGTGASENGAGSGPRSHPSHPSHPGGEHVGASSVSLDTPEDIELQKHITTRMAMLQRDPRYQRMQRTLASRRHWRDRLYEFTFLLDIALSIFAVLVAQHYRIILEEILHVDLYVHIFGISDTILIAILVAIIWPIVFSRFRLYSTSWLADRYSYFRVIAAVGVSTLAASGMLYFLTSSVDRTRIFLVFFSIVDAVFLVAARVILRPLVTTRLMRRRVLIVGTGRLALEATQSVAQRRRLGLELVGVVGPERDVLLETGPGSAEDMRASAKYLAWKNWRLGEIRDVVEIVQDRAVDLLLLALSPDERFETTWVISSVAHLPVQVYVVPDVVNEAAKTVTDSLDGMPMIGVAESVITGWTARAKRLLDLAISLPMVVVLWPLLVLIGVAVRLDSPGPAFFRQERVGQHNERFKMIKFRTMYIDAERRAREVALQTDEGLVHKRRNDPRVTRIGRVLRRTSLDELPQLFNVIKGDMSIVGPRPELPWIVERYRAWQYRRLLVPQGITGWWQIHGRSDRVLHLHTQDDIYYVRNHSFWLDLKILLMTIKVVLTGRGAY